MIDSHRSDALGSLAVNPLEGETLGDAIDRSRTGLRRIVRQNRPTTVALALRPMTLQIAAGRQLGEPNETIAGHLRNDSLMETIDFRDDAAQRLVAILSS